MRATLLVCVLLACLLLVPAPSPAASPAVPPVGAVGAASDAELDAYIVKAMADWKLPGLAIVVVKGGEPVYMKGFGTRAIDAAAPVDVDTRFGMMSTTKAMTALAIAMLVDEGKLAWDDPVQKTLPWFQMPDAAFSRQLTVRDTLRHNAGLGDDADLLWTSGMFSSRELLQRVHSLTPGYAPYAEFHYSNVMYQVAGELVSAASGIGWDRFVETRIMAPLGMTRSNATLAGMRAQRDDNVSSPHFEIDGTLRRIDDVPVDAVPAAGAAWSTARDAARWLQFLLGQGELDGRRLVSEANFRELLRPQVMVSAEEFYPSARLTRPHWMSYGLGWFQQDYRGQFVAMHTGSMDGRTAIIGLLPERDLGVYIFGNADHVELRHALMWKVFDLDAGAPPRDWSAELLALYGDLAAKGRQRRADTDARRVPGTRPTHAPAAYAGTYTHPAFGDIQVAQVGSGLALRLGTLAENAGPLSHWEYDTYRWVAGDGRYGQSTVRFEPDDNGGIEALSIRYGSEIRFVRKPVGKYKPSGK